MPTKVRLLADGTERFVSLEALRPGARFLERGPMAKEKAL